MAKQVYLGEKVLLLPNVRGGQDIKRAFVGGQRVVGQQYPLPASSTGDTVSVVDGFDVHQFTSDGTFTPQSTLEYEIFMVGAGGSGLDAGTVPSSYGGAGGGGGEVITGFVTLNAGTTYSVHIGDDPDGNTTFASITAHQGGDGGTGNSINNDGDNGYTSGTGTGGSGGGGAIDGPSRGRGDEGLSFAENGIYNGLYRYGNDGGVPHPTDGNGAGGGGGAGSIGGQALSNGTGGEGGAGIENGWLGSTLSYGGGGGGYPSGQGYGGGGNAASSITGNASTPRANSGGGGGGTMDPTTPVNGVGAAGIVLIRYRRGA